MTTEPSRRFDLLSAPGLFGGLYVVLFGLSAIDAAFGWGSSSYRLRYYFFSFQGVSVIALAYVWLGYGLFVLGYNLPAGSAISDLFGKLFLPLRHIRSFAFSQRRFFVLGTLIFVYAFSTMISTTQRFGAGRLQGSESFDLSFSYLGVAYDLAFILYALGVWRFMLSKRPGGDKMSKGETLFVWGCMFPLQVLFSVWLGTRSRLGIILLVAILAYHYGYRRISARSVVIGAFVFAMFLSPLIVFVRDPEGSGANFDSLSSVLAWEWDAIMARNSSLEGFTVTFENLNTVPQPDPLWMILGGGLIPRALWSNKPFSTWADEFSFWATGYFYGAYFPSLPGELLLHFGLIGGLMAMLALGVLWRAMHAYFIGLGEPPPAVGFIYVLLLSQAMASVEVGLVLPYAALVRLTAISLVVFFFVRASRSKVMRTPVVLLSTK